MSRVVRMRTNDIIDMEQIVEVNIDPSLQKHAALVCKESVKRDGRVVMFEIDGYLSTEMGRIAIEIKPLDNQRKLFATNILPLDSSRNILVTKGHKDNTTSEKDGVIDMQKQDSFAQEFGGLYLTALPLKISFAVVYGVISAWLAIPVVSNIAIFTCLAVIDWVVGLIPGIHPKTRTRFDTTILRFKQWGGSLIISAGLMAVQTLSANDTSEGWGSGFANHIYGYGTGFLISAYGMRLFWSLLKLFYGERAGKVRAHLIKLAPEKYRPFLDKVFLSE